MNEYPLTIQVDKQLITPIRLDRYLFQLLGNVAGFSRSRLQQLIEEKQVLVNKKSAKSSLKLTGGESIELVLPEPKTLELVAQDIPLSILYEDNHVLVLAKPAGLVVHPGAGISSGTLVNALLHHCHGKLSPIAGTLRPGIVHRLDKDTSGLMVIAKSDLAQQSLAKQISERHAKREYIALIEGHMNAKSGIIDKSIGRDKKDRKKMAITSTGRSAITHWQVIAEQKHFSLLRLRLQTGRTHQIRLHLASLNCPVVGDIVYNRKSTGCQAVRKKLGLKGHALHATYLSFCHPETEELLEFNLPSDPDFYTLLMEHLQN